MSALFSPIKLRGLTLKNRVVVSPMCQYSADDGVATDWHFTHINNLALSGASMFCIEATHVEAIGRITPGCLGLYSDACEAALKQILSSVRKHSTTAIAMQLAHAGRKASSARPWDGGQLIPQSQGGWQTVAPSALPHKEGEAAPLALDAAGLKRIREAFVDSAKRAMRIGIDAIELHGAHGYLMHQFLSPISNKRTDEYGGSLENRMRFPLEVYDAVRAAFPHDKPVGMRVSSTDWVEGGWDLAQTIEFAKALRPTWSRSPAACSTTPAGAGTPQPKSAAWSKRPRSIGARSRRRRRSCSARRRSGRGEERGASCLLSATALPQPQLSSRTSVSAEPGRRRRLWGTPYTPTSRIRNPPYLPPAAKQA